jgi:phage shock protein C
VQAPGVESAPEQPARAEPRRLEQVSEGALISGVCLGIARYLQVDVTLVRVIAVLLLFVSGGAMVVVYLILMLLLPYAPAQAGGAPIGKLPTKSREFVEFVRSKFSVATS